MTELIMEATSKAEGGPTSALSRRLLLALPAIAFVGLAAVFAWGISRDPSQLPLALIGKAVPTFDASASLAVLRSCCSSTHGDATAFER
ncbi:hypothetical protein AC244_09060 [Ensifer adhaerens]|uniref:Uncharacterized protein n=1 Tax=Ensifer adhaerens TaxID=106592 RepID=A0A0L8BZQ0_ENSAD|nr:hypothetical protein [Ensifer adhaerens]KOF20050.1 hypothetical protein AC244_09060 [Ensifer adhaerens]